MTNTNEHIIKPNNLNISNDVELCPICKSPLLKKILLKEDVLLNVLNVIMTIDHLAYIEKIKVDVNVCGVILIFYILLVIIVVY